ncbi:MAG: hypothetical protein L0H53_17095, partial [Candidatus Nitrosocosmicus sp.]|nr:hypothetical protein [Candidatus Nitrosocosmicus sp.]
ILGSIPPPDDFFILKDLIDYKSKHSKIKPRYLIEITKENMDYCKELLKIVNLHHLSRLGGNFITTDKECVFVDFSTNAKSDSTIDSSLSANLKEDDGDNDDLKRRRNQTSITAAAVATASSRLVFETASETVKQRHLIFNSFWNNSIPANERIRELDENEEEEVKNEKGNGGKKREGEINIILREEKFSNSSSNCSRGYDVDKKSTLFNSSNDGTINDKSHQSSDDIFRVIRTRKEIESILLSNICNSKSESVLVVSSINQLEYLCKIGLIDCIKQAKSHGSKTIILYPREQDKVIKTTKYETKKDSFISAVKTNCELRSISLIAGSTLVVDNSKILLMYKEVLPNRSAEVEGSNIYNNNDADDDINRNNSILGFYSDNKLIVKNFGSLFETLINEKEMFETIISAKNDLEDSNKHLEEANRILKIKSKAQLDFINLAAHELRTPTHAIIGYSEMLETLLNFSDENSSNSNNKSNSNKDNTFENSQRYLSSIIRNSKRLERLVGDLLDTNKIES